jgi:hypothetical protein
MQFIKSSWIEEEGSKRKDRRGRIEEEGSKRKDRRGRIKRKPKVSFKRSLETSTHMNTNTMNNIQWFFYNDEIINARMRDTGNKISTQQLETVVFDTTHDTVKFFLPINSYDAVETVEMQTPLNVNQVLTMIQDFYKKPLEQETLQKSFQGESDEFYNAWRTYRNNVENLQNYHLLNDSSGLLQFREVVSLDDGYLVVVD